MFQNLIAQGLVKEKKYPNGLSVFKYSREVFYKALWNTDPLLLEARGMVLDAEGNKVIWPFTKVFNYNENGTTLHPDTVVIAPRKVNGFMASVTRYHDEILVSTTGTLDSDYVGYAKEMLEPLDLAHVKAGYTFLFEIVHPVDPHIIEEEFGAYLIGCRRHETGTMATERSLDSAAHLMGAMRPEWIQCTFSELLKINAECKHEGHMVRLRQSETTVMKLKSPHYLTKKFLMRMGKNKVEYMFNEKEEFLKNTDEEFYGVVNHITRFFTMEDWKARDDVARRAIIEEFFENTQR
ncbi:RNA ligase [Pseudomonas phage phiK7A1]|uniref:RNA ligase n=1 Tax=Pseudomonas phage phiK7A1 TaxID=2759194 RepID=A0A7H0XFN6_9CAUD|nr:RNA ligase [Pseudomonas phage phiK7A1]